MEASHWSRSLENDATVQADYTLTTRWDVGLAKFSPGCYFSVFLISGPLLVTHTPVNHSQPLQQQLLNSFSNVLIAFYGFSCQELVGTLSQICPDSGQLTAWLNGSLWDSNGSDWRDALNRTDMLMTLIKQYTEVCKCYCD